MTDWEKYDAETKVECERLFQEEYDRLSREGKCTWDAAVKPASYEMSREIDKEIIMDLLKLATESTDGTIEKT